MKMLMSSDIKITIMSTSNKNSAAFASKVQPNHQSKNNARNQTHHLQGSAVLAGRAIP